MRTIALLLMSVTSPCVVVQDTAPKPTVSSEPLNADQIAIYRGFLETYTKGNDKPLNVANVTAPLSDSAAEIKAGEGCLKGIPLESVKQANSIVHHIDPPAADGLRIKLVDPQQQISVVKQNDPGQAARQGHKEIDKAVDTAFATGLFAFSEIAFDKKHTTAVLAFSFYCGSLCGHGGILVFHKTGNRWKLAKRDCDFWMS